jgi:hypothetical protein
MDEDIDKIMNMMVAEALMRAITERPATEKMAWIELHEDVLEEAYDMSQEYREYD